MKNIILLTVFIAFLSNTAIAQEPITFNKKGEVIIKTSIPTNGKKVITDSGKEFKFLRAIQTNGKKLAYSIRYNNVVLPTDEISLYVFQIKNKGEELYSSTIINKEKTD